MWRNGEEHSAAATSVAEIIKAPPFLIMKRTKKVWLRIVLAAALVHLAPAFAQAPKEAVASPDLQKEFDGFIGIFRAALKANDFAAVAGMTRLPFEYNGSIHDTAQFRAETYRTSSRQKIARASSGLNNDNYFIFCDDLIFVFTKTPAGFLLTEIGMND